MAAQAYAPTQTVPLVENLGTLYQPVIDTWLLPGENVRVAVTGLYHASALAATDRRLIILKDFGRQTFTVNLVEIVAVTMHRPLGPLATNYVEVHTGCGTSNAEVSPHRSPTCVPFGNAEREQDKFEGAVKAIRELLHSAQRTPLAAQQHPSVFAQALHLASRHRAGAITDEDYSRQKQELLACI